MPLSSLGDEHRDYYQKFLKLISPEKFICFQNSKDPLGSFDEVEQFIKKANSSFKVVKKDRADQLSFL